MLYLKFQITFRRMLASHEVLVKQFDRIVEQMPNKTAIIYHGERTRFIDLQLLSHKIANWVESNLNLGLDDSKFSSGSNEDTVEPPNIPQAQIGLMLGNTPDLVAFVIGIARVRVASVLFNTNHRRDSLLHALMATNCQVFVFGNKYLDAIREIVPQLPDQIKFFMYDQNILNEINNNNNNNSKFDHTNYFNYNGVTKEYLLYNSSSNSPTAAVDNFAEILTHYSDEPLQRKYTYSLSDNVSVLLIVLHLRNF